MAFVVVEKGNSKDIEKRFPLGEGITIIGRSIPQNSPAIPLNDVFISRHHAELSFQNKSYMIRDLKSTNGTTVNGVRLEPGKFYQLEHDTAIGLGISPDGPRVILRFKETLTVSTARIEDDQKSKTNIAWLKVDENRREFVVDEERLQLSRKEYDLLLFLYNNAGNVCDRDTLINNVWPEVDDTGYISDASIDQLIRRIRVKIEPDPSHPQRLISKKGFGYILVS